MLRNSTVSSPSGGDVWRYPYLWRRQHEAGETEGRKHRPTAFVAAMPGKSGNTDLFILAITSNPPGRDRVAISIPEIERRRAGLDPIPLWIILDEYNHDVADGSYYFEPGARIGAFSSPFHKRVLREFLTALRSRRSKAVPRYD